MFRITRIFKVAVFAVLVAAAAVMAGSARASATAVIDTDSVPTIGTSSFSFAGTVDWLLSDGVFTPPSPALARIHRELKGRFDPDRLFNPGRLYPEL